MKIRTRECMHCTHTWVTAGTEAPECPECGGKYVISYPVREIYEQLEFNFTPGVRDDRS